MLDKGTRKSIYFYFRTQQRRDPRFGSPASSSVPPSVERKSKSKPSNDYSDISKLRAQLERQEERLAQVRKDIQNDAKKGLRDEVYSQTMKKMMGMKKLTAEGLLAGKGGIAKNEEWGGMQTASKSKWSVVTNSGHNTGSTEKKNAIDMIDAAAEAMRFTNERKRREKMKRKFMKKQKKQEAKKRKEVENR